MSMPPLETPDENASAFIRLSFIMGELSGTVSALRRAVDAMPAGTAELARKVDALERDNDRRHGQNSILTIVIAAGTSIVVGIIIYFATRGLN